MCVIFRFFVNSIVVVIVGRIVRSWLFCCVNKLKFDVMIMLCGLIEVVYVFLFSWKWRFVVWVFSRVAE